MSLTTDQLVAQHKRHTHNLKNGDLAIALPGGVYDLFSGDGWDTPIRFRIVKFRDKSRAPQLLQISGGTTLTREYREELLKELSHGT
jgi:hypothetical protein